jgi:hypothetical protein
MFRRRRSAEDFAEEIKVHLELEADELKGEGLSEDEARWKARREFGNVRRAQEQFYVKGRLVWLDSLLGICAWRFVAGVEELFWRGPWRGGKNCAD